MMDSDGPVGQAKEKAGERVSMTRAQAGALYVGAATGVAGFLAHIGEVLDRVL